MKLSKKAKGSVIVAAAIAGLVALPAPASAATSTCQISAPYISCSTGTLYPNSGNWMRLLVSVPNYGETVCRMHDADTGDEVGSASRGWWDPSWFTADVKLYGLYNKYFVACVNTSKVGRGGLRNDNG